MPRTEQPTLTSTSFPVTGQPIRVVTIDGEPWFATADVCRILGRNNPSWANQLVAPHETQTVDLREVTLISNEGYSKTAGRKSYERGNPLLSLVSESGLYTLVLRSRKPAARPFQQWVTSEFLPALRRGEADPDAQRERMAETLTEALGLDQPIDLVARVDGLHDADFRVLTDGTVHCAHGRTEVCLPRREEDSGPPFGPFFRCPEVKRIGIRGSRSIRTCGTIRFVDVVRRLIAPREPETPPAPPAAPRPPFSAGLLSLKIGQARVLGTAKEIAQLLMEMGVDAV
ncbi:BRO-N domain-containing protein [Streptacidiphilus carbonis]|uniref:BRO-N domain-containing protein n=1 Tax=Streptacidiphilus carbonis TaxID=105422 RepID=UPI000694C954|nr:Bro-N domain-containing protein [Streptacidiphilus carbonis]